MTTHSLDACLRVVTDRHRRRILHYLRHETTGSTTVDALADQLHTGGSPRTNGQQQSREQLAIRLYHIHLPKLTAHGVVEFDYRTGAIRYRADEQVETVLDSLPEELPLLDS